MSEHFGWVEMVAWIFPPRPPKKKIYPTIFVDQKRKRASERIQSLNIFIVINYLL